MGCDRRDGAGRGRDDEHELDGRAAKTCTIGSVTGPKSQSGESHTAAAANHFLSEQGLTLRGLGNYNLPNCLRLTIGVEEANRKVVAGLGKFLGKT